MERFFDILFFWLHIVIILFNLLGWIWVKTRRIHLVVVTVTLFSWLILGIKYGLGYCFLTDWHWNVKYELGETNLPASFVKYFFDNYTPISLSAQTVDWITIIAFGIAILMTLYVNFIRKMIYKKRS